MSIAVPPRVTPQGADIFARGFAASMAPQRVLLVDDQPATLRMLRSGLERAWPTCRIDTAGTSSQAQPLITVNHYDAVVTDYFLSDGTGLHLAQLARRYQPAASIILTSASLYALADAQADARRAGIGLLSKPLDLGQLVRALESATGVK